MILTVTPNPALDRVIYIEAFEPETVMRTTHVVNSVGGKGIDSSVALRTMGVETVGMCYLAGDIGHQLEALIEAYGITSDSIWVGGETRIAHVISETKLHRHSHIIIGEIQVTPEDLDTLIERCRSHLKQADWLITGGSLPPGVPETIFGTLAELGREAGVPVLVDTSGKALPATLHGQPTILKMNRAEFLEAFGAPSGNLDDLVTRGQEILVEAQIPTIILTLGKEGLLALTQEGVFHAVAPPQTQVNAAGAGDAASAALAWRLSLGESWPEPLRWAAAAGAAVVLTEGTTDCDMDEIHRIYDLTQVRQIRSG